MYSKREFVGVGVLTAIIFGFATLAVSPAFAQTDDYGTTAGTYCPQLFQTVVRGSSSNQVLELQKFLSDYYDIPPATIQTGYFGRITQGYVIQFQKEQGLPSYGIAGSMTRAAIAKVCGGSGGTVSTNFSASPTSGAAPLAVVFRSNANGTINFGDGTSDQMSVSCLNSVNSGGSSGNCNTLGNYYTGHTYASVGTYTAILTTAGSCAQGYCAQAASVTITVTGKQTIAPPTITSLQPAAGAVGTAVTIKGSGFAASNSIYLNDTFVETQNNNNGSIPASITFVIPVGFGEVCYSDGRGCSAKIVNPGNYTISVRNANGTSNSVAFTVTGGQTITLPTVSSLSPTSGPVSFTNVTITGTGFTSTGNDIHFGPVGGIKNISSNGTSLTFTVPLAVTACDFSADPQSCTTAQIINIGDYQVYVQNSNGTSNSKTFTVTGGQTI